MRSRTAARFVVARQLALGLALASLASGCTTTRHTLARAWGAENGLYVRAVASVTDAYYVKGEGLVLFGYVTPGSPAGGPIRLLDQDDPPVAPFVAALSEDDFRSGHPRLRYYRFHARKAQDLDCVKGFANSEPHPEWIAGVRNPEGVPLRDLRLESQSIAVRFSEAEPPTYVSLGPRGGDWAQLLLVPFTLAFDVVKFTGEKLGDYVIAPLFRRMNDRPAPVAAEPEVCESLEKLLFPPRQALPPRVAAGP